MTPEDYPDCRARLYPPDVTSLLRRFGAYGALVALIPGFSLILPQRPGTSALAIVLALFVLIVGVALLFNWRGMASSTAEQTREAFGDALRFRGWEVRMIGGFYVFAGALLLGGAINYG